MTEARGSDGRPAIYQIRIQGHLSRQWADRFEELSITQEDGGVTLLSGPIIDQAALHGILKKVRDLGMPLLSVNVVGTYTQGPQEVGGGWGERLDLPVRSSAIMLTRPRSLPSHTTPPRRAPQ